MKLRKFKIENWLNTLMCNTVSIYQCQRYDFKYYYQAQNNHTQNNKMIHALGSKNMSYVHRKKTIFYP